MGFFKRIFSSLSKKDMYHDATFQERDRGGNYWYVPKWAKDLFNSGSEETQVEYNLSTTAGKRLALKHCYPFATVIGRCAKMMQNGKFYVVDENGNEQGKYKDIRLLLEQPNPLQNSASFLNNVETCLRCYGFCPIYLLRIGPNSPTRQMVVIPPYLFHITGTGKMFSQQGYDELIERAYIQWGDTEQTLEPYEYTVIYDGTPELPSETGGEIRFQSCTDSLTMFARNYMSAMIARYNLIVNGGPKGIIYGNDNSEFGNAAMTPKEKDEMNERFKQKFGLVKRMYQVMVTDKKVGYIPLGSNVEQLKLHHEDEQCMNDICNAIGAQPDLFTNGSTYENKEAAKRATYQDLIIPDAANIANALTKVLCKDGTKITIDFSDVPCLQADKKDSAESLVKVSQAINTLLNGILTPTEARIELARYIDIDPENPLGLSQVVGNNSGKEDTTD